MKMTTAMLVLGSLIVFWASTFIMVFLPTLTWKIEPSKIWRPMTPTEAEGLDLYVQNGCSYCHTLFVRVQDWGVGAHRIAEEGDYQGMQPAIMGTERWGPDLSQEGGRHPDDWHLAHFTNPRFTSPISVMPMWEFLGPEKIAKLTAYVQYLGWQMADARHAAAEELEGSGGESVPGGAGREHQLAARAGAAGLARDAQPLPGLRRRPGPRQEDLPDRSASTATGRSATATAPPPPT